MSSSLQPASTPSDLSAEEAAMRDCEVVRALYAATGAGDWATAEAMLDDAFYIVEPPSLPYGGEWRGRGALRTLFEKVMGFWQDPALDLHAMTGGDGRVVCLLTMHVTAPGSGQRLALPLAETFRIRDGKVVELVPYYYDTAAIAEATRGSVC